MHPISIKQVAIMNNIGGEIDGDALTLLQAEIRTQICDQYIPTFCKMLECYFRGTGVLKALMEDRKQEREL